MEKAYKNMAEQNSRLDAEGAKMKRYLKYIKPYWYAFILGPILMITEVVGEVILPAYMAKIIIRGCQPGCPLYCGTGITMTS